MGDNVAVADKDWEADSDCRTLIDAKEIQNDPKRLKAAMAKAKEKMKALKEVQADG